MSEAPAYGLIALSSESTASIAVGVHFFD